MGIISTDLNLDNIAHNVTVLATAPNYQCFNYTFLVTPWSCKRVTLVSNRKIYAEIEHPALGGAVQILAPLITNSPYDERECGTHIYTLAWASEWSQIQNILTIDALDGTIVVDSKSNGDEAVP